MTEGWMYLHANGDLIYKRELGDTVRDLMESDLVRAFWPVDKEDRATAWRIVVEGLAAGARSERVQALAEKWGCTDQDATVYAERVGVDLHLHNGAWRATRRDFVSLQKSEAGFGGTALEAMAELAQALGYRTGKPAPDFADLVA